MERLTTDTPSGNFETMMNFVYGKDGWAYIRHDGEHEDIMLTDWAKRQCKLHGCDEVLEETPEDIDQRLCECMMEAPVCPIALAYCFASQAVHLRSRLKMHEDAMPIERAQELAQAEKDGRLVVLPCKVGDMVYRVITTRDTAPIMTEIEIKSLAQAIELIGEIGKHKVVSWYMTLEEAEAALKKREEADNEAD